MSSALSLKRKAQVALLVVTSLGLFVPPVWAANPLDGVWSVTMTIPQSPNSSLNQTLSVTLNVSPLGDSLVGRMTITDSQNRMVGGVWRQVGKHISITYELPCGGPSDTCATLVMLARLKGDRLKGGQVIVMWDVPNDKDPALYQTSNGSFTGTRGQ
jgi:hypothetical protein